MKKSTGEVLKVFFVIVGVVVSLSALVAVAYTVFKKYFQVTFECDGDCEDCDDCFGEEEGDFEPICCCEEYDDMDDEPICDCGVDAE